MSGFLAGSPLLRAQQDPFRDHSRIPGLNELVTVFDFEPIAYAKVLRYNYDYTAYGTDTEFTLRRNREAFDWVQIVPKKVLDAAPVQTAIEVLGTKMPYPIFVSPSAGHGALHPDAEAATYKGATAANTPYIVSGVSTLPFEKVAAAGGGPLWYQMYPRQDLDASRELLDKVQGAGAKAVVVTIDQQAAEHDRTLHGHIARPQPDGASPCAAPHRTAESVPPAGNAALVLVEIRSTRFVPSSKCRCSRRVCSPPRTRSFAWSTEWTRSTCRITAAAVWTTHRRPLEVLPEIVDAVGGKVPILFDSGIRRGSDIVKALALGATAICLGRVPRWGLAAYGAPGVQRTLEIMQGGTGAGDGRERAAHAEVDRPLDSPG